MNPTDPKSMDAYANLADMQSFTELEIIEPKSPYTEDVNEVEPIPPFSPVTHIALVRQRLMNCRDDQLYQLLSKVNEMLRVLPEIPMTETQRMNAQALTIGFKSLFAVRRIGQ